MGKFVNNITSEKLVEQHSKPIDVITAGQYMGNYNADPLDIKTANGQPVKGFYFDASDIIKAVSQLNGTNDQIYIALGKKTDSDAKEDYTLIITCVEYNSENDQFNYVYDRNDHPWYEFSKPCPDRCPS